MEQSPVRILLVDDFEPWRQFVSSILGKQPELRIVAEVSDGLEAVQKSRELQPDLIVLDIGLPKLNGLEAARRIRQVAPGSKILFVSQDSSPGVVQEAFRAGAQGYVVKAYAGSELLTAVEALLRNSQFLSAAVPRDNLDIPDCHKTSDEDCQLDCPFVQEGSEGMFRVDMDNPMSVNLPEEEQIRRILFDSHIGDCNEVQAKMYGLNAANDLIGRRLADLVLPNDPKNIELTRQFIRSGYQVLSRKSYEVDVRGNSKVFLNSMVGVIVDGKLVTTWGKQSDVTETENVLSQLEN